MSKSLLLFLILSSFTFTIRAQDSIRYRIIFIGDAGEMNPTQKQALTHASNHIIEGKTMVMYLGDNVYPRGIGLSDATAEDKREDYAILRSQYEPMRKKGAPVFFLPGNHDWDKTGVHGLAKIQRQWRYIESRGDSLLKLIPPNGCPDPVEIPVNENLVVIAFDSEWWLFPFDKKNPECECQTQTEILEKLALLRYKNRNKIILLASHHPFQSYGEHGGKYSFKDHVFPFTILNRHLYIPLPVVGSLYPLLRTTFYNQEDIKHPRYRNMINSIDAVFDSFPNLVHVAGHEHGLQFIKGKTNNIQIVSGAGAKHTNAVKTKYSLFAKATQGYVTADLMLDNSMQFNYYEYVPDTIKQAFTYILPYKKQSEYSVELYKAFAGDSITVRVHPDYDKHSKLHRKVFGENYRKDWAQEVTLPVIRISEFNGGLTPTELGGGKQSKSLRLKDKNGKEWVIRSVEKNASKILPPALQETFARDWLDDATSAQHPFSALVVPPIANAVNVPHATPVIGVVAPDKALGVYGMLFTNEVVLLEEREPLGESDNTAKMQRNIQKDNDNRIDAKEFLRARMLDMYIADWDRHEDQWRWKDTSNGKSKSYLAIPRDRDQVFHLIQGVVPKIAAREYIIPELADFENNLEQPKWLINETRFANSFPEAQLGHDEWMKEVDIFTASITDSVLEAGLKRLPEASYKLRHDEFLAKLKARRIAIPNAMEAYYKFIQKIVDIKTSDKNELIEINGVENGDLNVKVHKIAKNGSIEDELMNKTYDHSLTKEIRVYAGNGNDSIVVNNKTSNIRLRLIGQTDEKAYNVIAAKNKIKLYQRRDNGNFSGDSAKIKTKISNDSLSTVFTPVNLYNIWQPLTSIGLNYDDGLILGGGVKFTRQEGFRKYPYASQHQLTAAHSFSTKAYRIRYSSEWIHVFNTADITLNALARAPNNTINFFGVGNNTVNDKTGNDKRFYRTRFSTFQVDPAIRWRNKQSKTSFVSIGPSWQYYRYSKGDNDGRFITTTTNIGSYDSLTLQESKMHLGAVFMYSQDKRNNKVLPQYGSYFNVRIQGYGGLGKFAKSYAQVIPEFAFYKNLNSRSTVILANRMGGTVSIGSPAFYQSAFLGGQENLLGFRQYRFAGQHSFYNNMELRIKISDIANYILPGQFGITGFWDAGRVWEKHDNSAKWHNGVGGGIYFAPASLVAFNFVMGHSTEGWYPYFTMGLRF